MSAVEARSRRPEYANWNLASSREQCGETLRLTQVRLSGDASLVVFDSYFFQPGKWRAVSIETGIPKAR